MNRGTRGKKLIQLVFAEKNEIGHLKDEDRPSSSSKEVVSLLMSDNEGQSSLDNNPQCQRQESPLTLEQLAVVEEIECAIDWDPKTTNENVSSEESCDDSVADPDYTLSDSLDISSDDQSPQTLPTQLPSSHLLSSLPPKSFDSLPEEEAPYLPPTQMLAQPSPSHLPSMPFESPPEEPSLETSNLTPTQLPAQPSPSRLASMPSQSPPEEPSLERSNLTLTQLLAQPSPSLFVSMSSEYPPEEPLLQPSYLPPAQLPAQPSPSRLASMPSESPPEEPTLQPSCLPPAQLLAQPSPSLLVSMSSEYPPEEPLLQPSYLPPAQLPAQPSPSRLASMHSESPPEEPPLQPSYLPPAQLLAQPSPSLLASMSSEYRSEEPLLQPQYLPPAQLSAQPSPSRLASMHSEYSPEEAPLQPSYLPPAQLLAQPSPSLLASMPSESRPEEPSLETSILTLTKLPAQPSPSLLASMPCEYPPEEPLLQPSYLPPAQLHAQPSSSLLALMPSEYPPEEPTLQPTQIHAHPSPSNLTLSSYPMPSESPPVVEASPLPAPNSVNNAPHDDTTTTPKRHKRKVEELWKRNVQKYSRNSGAEYVDSKGNLKAARKPQNIGNPCSCKQKCHVLLSDENKQSIFDAFWNLKDLDRQRDFLANNVTEIETKNPRVEKSRRKYTLTYNFTYGNVKRQVCKKFFLETLNVTDKMVRTALNKRRRGTGDIVSPDKRGRHPPGIKISEESLNHANCHIDSFPTVPSHWCRKDSKKVYLEPILNKEKMYGLYLEKCTQEQLKPISKTSYRELLIKKNIGFYIPRKDQCWCHRYELLPEDEKLQKQTEYDLHQRRKLNAYKQKQEDGKKSKSDPSYLCGNFDLEAVLYSPLVHAKPVFYKRKLATFNFTLYEVATKQGHCFMWSEYEGNRGSNEVSTCLFKFIKDIPITVSHLVLYADCCPGQNRNSILVSMFLAAIAAEDCCLDTIDLKFLEPGHTYMECDSMHATIELASESAKIYIPDDWENVVKLARKKKPFKITNLHHDDFIDFKSVRESQLPDKIVSQDGTQLYWTQVKWLRFTKQSLDTFDFKLEYWDEEFKKVKILPKTTTRSSATGVTASRTLPQAYNSQIPIKAIKYKDLQELCKSGLIPSTYHPYFKNLPTVTPEPSQNTKSQKKKPVLDDPDEIALAASKASYIKRRRRI